MALCFTFVAASWKVFSLILLSVRNRIKQEEACTFECVADSTLGSRKCRFFSLKNLEEGPE